MIRAKCLDKDGTRFLPTAGTTRDLGYQLKGAFSRAEIGKVQAGVRVDNSDNCDVGKIEALGDHLRTQQHVVYSRSKLGQGQFVTSWLFHGIAVHSQAACGREASPDLFFEPLRTHAPK